MLNKLKVIIVDDDPFSVTVLQDNCKNSPVAEVVASFTDPREFLAKAPSLKFDICILDILMPEMEGTMVAQLLKDKPVIFVTGVYTKLREALELSPIDIVTKPIYKARLDKALGKAYALVVNKNPYKVFNVAEAAGKVKLYLPDIMLVVTDTTDARHKQVFMRSGNIYTLMDYSIEEILESCPMLVQASKGVAVSIEVVNEVEHDKLTLQGLKGHGAPNEIHLSRIFRRGFIDKLSYF